MRSPRSYRLTTEGSTPIRLAKSVPFQSWHRSCSRDEIVSDVMANRLLDDCERTARHICGSPDKRMFGWHVRGGATP